MTMTEARQNGRAQMPPAANIPEPAQTQAPPTSKTPSTIDAVNERSAANVHLVQGVVRDQLRALREHLDDAEKMLDQDAERLLRIQSDFVHSAGVLLNLKDGAEKTLDALRAGRARLVAVADGETV